MTRRPKRLPAPWGPRALAVVLGATAVLFGAAGTAHAHNVLVSTSPANGSMPAVVPGQVTLTFDQPALAVGTILVVTGPTGQEQNGAALLVNKTVTERVRPGSPAGRYTVAWRVSSADGHLVSGTFAFTAMAPSSGQQASATTATAAAPSAAVGAGATARTGVQASTLWWLAGGVAALLLLAAFIVTRKPRTTPTDERDPSA